ncbi:hypothetical protein ACQR3P_28690 [Rhodococcus sp. IEGM1300]
MITYLDNHNGQTRTERMLKVTLKNGKQGVAAIGSRSSINEFDFDSNELSTHSIAGVLDLRFDIDRAVAEYNSNQMEWSSYDGRQIASYEEMGVEVHA